MAQPIYLDHNATTPLDPRVLEKMMPYLTHEFGNASSLTHRYGRKAHGAIDHARNQLAQLIHAHPEEVYFTSGATESVNTILNGVFEGYSLVGKHFITCVTEHKAVLDTLAYLQSKGAEVTYLGVNELGELDLDLLESTIRPETIMMIFMAANNETGVCHPIEKIASLAQDRGVLFFCDASQMVGKMPVNLQDIPVDLLALSGHKMYGPKGVGAMYIRRKSKRIALKPLLNGGGQENLMRAGTYNVPGIVGVGMAAEIAVSELPSEQIRLAQLRNAWETAILEIPEVKVNGLSANRMPHVSNLTFRHLRASDIMTSLPVLALSSGSACVSGDRAPSHVLMGMGLSEQDAKASIRVSFGRFNTEEECKIAISSFQKRIPELRMDSPFWQLYQKGLL